MAVYVDQAIWVWKDRKWCHLMADSETELHQFAFRLGLKLSSYQGPPKTRIPHYDITGFERDRAVRLGAQAIDRRRTVQLIQKQRVTKTEMMKAGADLVPKLPQKKPG
ncbi:MAG: DUF4031 domain-containing protein [Salaquimonas sp.]